MKIEEKIFRINGLLEKWDKGTITDEEVLEIARNFMHIPDGANTPALAEKFKKVINSEIAQYQRNYNTKLILTAREETQGNFSIGYIVPEKGYIPFAFSSNKKISFSKKEFEFEIHRDGSFDVIKTLKIKDGTSEQLIDYCETIEHVDKFGFVKSIERYLLLDFDKGISLSLARAYGYGRYSWSKVSICDEPDRVRKTYIEYKKGKTYQQKEMSITLEKSASDEHCELGSVSESQLPDIQEVGYYITDSAKFIHTNPGHADDVLISGASLTQGQLVKKLDEVKDQTRKRILTKRLKHRISNNQVNQ